MVLFSRKPKLEVLTQEDIDSVRSLIFRMRIEVEDIAFLTNTLRNMFYDRVGNVNQYSGKKENFFEDIRKSFNFSLVGRSGFTLISGKNGRAEENLIVHLQDILTLHEAYINPSMKLKDIPTSRGEVDSMFFDNLANAHYEEFFEKMKSFNWHKIDAHYYNDIRSHNSSYKPELYGQNNRVIVAKLYYSKLDGVIPISTKLFMHKPLRKIA